jgi:hypothetical protein
MLIFGWVIFTLFTLYITVVFISVLIYQLGMRGLNFTEICVGVIYTSILCIFWIMVIFQFPFEVSIK